MSYSFKEEDLTKEKSLWDIYKLSRRILPNKVQFILILVFALLLSSNALFFSDDSEKILKDVREWSKIGFSFTITALGFLIAGFTIFATLSKPKMLLAMMDHIDSKTGLPTLKYNFIAFMKVFIAYIVFSLFYLSILVLGGHNGIIDNAIELLPQSELIKTCVINIAYTITGSSFVYLLMLLKSFVFNIYAIVMNNLRWEYHQ